MPLDFLYVALGLVLLVFAGDALVKGAVGLALRLGIPALIVGLTVVAFGTSAPEMIVSVKAALAGRAGIALGNVVGSNIANILLILGLPALIATIHSSLIDTRRSYLVMLATTGLFIGLCLVGPITWWHALILLAGLALVLRDNLRSAQAHRALNGARNGAPELQGADAWMPVWKIAAFILAGLAGLAAGAELLVEGAVNIARLIGVSEAVIGLTLVAVGTSLPELMTTVMAAFRKQADVALGNVIGSNIFNLLAIIGVAGLFGDMAVPESMLRFDLWFMLAMSLLLAPFLLLKHDITRGLGAGLVATYAGYTLWLVL